VARTHRPGRRAGPLVVELERIPDGERKTEEELWERFEAEHPKLLGALFDVLAKAIARKPSLKLSRRPRLADWGEYAAAVYEVMGWGAEQFLEDWEEIVRVQNQATLDGSPVAQAIIKFMQDKEEYTATSSELHKELEAVAETLGVAITRDKAWPKSARWLWRRIKEVLPLLAVIGIQATRREVEGGNEITLRKLPKSDTSNARTNENSVGKPKMAGNTAHPITSSNTSPSEPNTRTGNRPSNTGASNTSEKAVTYPDCANTGNTGIRNGDVSVPEAMVSEPSDEDLSELRDLIEQDELGEPQ
jgi:hypothetical protein